MKVIQITLGRRINWRRTKKNYEILGHKIKSIQKKSEQTCLIYENMEVKVKFIRAIGNSSIFEVKIMHKVLEFA